MIISSIKNHAPNFRAKLAQKDSHQFEKGVYNWFLKSYEKQEESRKALKDIKEAIAQSPGLQEFNKPNDEIFLQDIGGVGAMTGICFRTKIDGKFYTTEPLAGVYHSNSFRNSVYEPNPYTQLSLDPHSLDEINNKIRSLSASKIKEAVKKASTQEQLNSEKTTTLENEITAKIKELPEEDKLGILEAIKKLLP